MPDTPEYARRMQNDPNYDPFGEPRASEYHSMSDEEISEKYSPSISELVLPTIQACKEFGICRTNEDIIAKSKPNTYGFITGPQTKNIFSSENFDFENKFYDTFNYKPQFINTTDPIHSFEKNVLDEVILEFLVNKPTKSASQENTGRVFHVGYKEQIKEDEVRYRIRVAPNTLDWMKFDHTAEWGEPEGFLHGIIKFIRDASDQVQRFLTDLQNIATESSKSRKVMKSEFTHEWQGTKNITFDIPFILFTAGGSLEAFRRDIYSPIMLLNQLIHPRRYTDEDGDSNRVEGVLNKVDKFIEGGFPGSRLAILKQPNHVRITHSSGLFRFARCGITNFSYSYKGPWVKTGENDGNSVEQDYSSVFGMKNFMDRGFPCIAECKLTLTTLDPLYADDWLEMYNNSDVVQISDSEKGRDANSSEPSIVIEDPNDPLPPGKNIPFNTEEGKVTGKNQRDLPLLDINPLPSGFRGLL